MVTPTPASYPVNDTSLSAGERAYLEELQGYAATQNLEQDLRSETRNLSTAFTVLATVVVGLRFVARHKQNAPYGVDDWLIVVSLVLLFGNLAFNLVMISQGLGLHSGLLTIDELMKLNQTVVGAEVLYTTGVNLYKLSLLFLYFRIFPLPTIRRWGLVCGGISTAWNIACIFAASFQCIPRTKIWEPWVSGYCIDIFLAQLCISVPSILCDIAILCFPLPHILRLKTNRTQKILLVIIFMLGSYVVFTSIYRFVVYLAYTKKDIPYTLAIPCAWNIIEISSGIISSTLPTLVRPFPLFFSPFFFLFFFWFGLVWFLDCVGSLHGCVSGGSHPLSLIPTKSRNPFKNRMYY
ncbi:hypothetical protein BD289DRAFT_65915 [Coniella lustricola]|uniref:Rhodopsin domain-containing protein n=1 Tax=Coniella lustricola TaxID=2025994 RepID=A0A2T3AI17_9PEZI|nr:hypothetical protein BD289DRAFT_65915 [Coniella lustricola]